MERAHHDFWATAVEHDAVRRWTAVLGRSDRIPLESPVPRQVELPGIGRALVYMLCLPLLTVDERDRLVLHLSGTFDLERVEVERELERHGLPILADTVFVVILRSQRWF